MEEVQKKEKQFYSYLWLREKDGFAPAGTPYYAGKGYGKRAYRKGGPRPDCIKIFPMESEELSFESEVAIIELFGRKDLGTGILINHTDGGEGASGYVFTPEGRHKISVGNTGKKRTTAAIENYRLAANRPEKLAIASKNGTRTVAIMRSFITAESHIKQRITNTGKVRSPESIAKYASFSNSPSGLAIRSANGKRRKGAVVSLETRKLLRDFNLGRKHTAEDIQKQIKAQTGKKRPSYDSLPARHVRWHVNRGITNPDCALCQQQECVA